MKQIKIFKHGTIKSLERQVNEFLKNPTINLLEIMHSPPNFWNNRSIVILYEEIIIS